MTRSPRLRGRVRSLVLVLLVAALGAAPSGASPTGAPDRSDEAVRRLADAMRPAGAAEISHKTGAPPARQMPSTMTPSKAFATAFPTLDAAKDPAGYVQAERALLEAFWPGEDVFQAREQLAASAGAAAAEGISTDRVVLAAQDLTGDGLNDGLGVEIQFRETTEGFEIFDISLAGVRGTDGDVRWTTKIAHGIDGLFDTFVLVSPDLDGDGADDVVVLRFELTDEAESANCIGVTCLFEGSFTYRWTLLSLSGIDGSQLWSRTFEGRLQYQDAFGGAVVAGAEAISVEATNAAILPLVSADHDKDGGAELIIDALDVRQAAAIAGAGAFVAAAFAITDNVFVATNAEVTSGATGQTLSTRSASYQPGGSLLLAAGNAVGDATGDLLWETFTDVSTPFACAFAVLVADCAGAFSEQLRIEMIDGATQQTAWGATTVDPLQAYAFGYPGFGDLNGDGAEDVVVFSWGSQIGIAATSGADGSTLWSTSYDTFDIGLIPVGVVGGGPGVDLLVLEMAWDADGLQTDMARIDGASGDELLRTTVEAGGEDFSLFIFEAGDVDGDGAIDIATELYAYENDGYGFAFAIESGGTGASLFASTQRRAYLPGGDLDGDGADDLLTFDATWHRQSIDITTAALSMPSGSTAWSHTDSFMPYSYAGYVPAGNVDGGVGEDVLASWFQYVGRVGESRYEALDGTDGVRAWTAGDAFTPPPPTGTGSIAGTITGPDGAPLRQMCVEPYDADRTPLGASVTAADGTYFMAELNPGAYRVFVSDCRGSTYADRWYADAGSFDTATPVTLADGEALTGVDQQLAALPTATNDLIANALEITALPFSDQRSTLEATTEPGEPDPCGPAGATVWYRFTAAADGSIRADTFRSNFDTVLAAYAGTPSETSVITCNDDHEDWQSQITFDVSAGQTYYVQAGGFFGEQGKLVLSIDLS